MSFEALAKVIKLQGISPTEKLLLVVLANYGDEFDRCYPSQATMAREVGCTDRTITTTLANLEDKGLIHRRARVRQDGGRTSDLITLRLENISPPPGEAKRPAPVKLSQGGGETISEKPTKGTYQGNRGEIDAGAADLFGSLPEKAKPEPIDVEAAFDQFWAVYPRKVAKGAARPAFEKALARINDINPVAVIMRGVISFAAECEGKDPQFTAHPATWLNGDGFYDEPGARRPANVERPSSASRSAERLDTFTQAAYELAQERRERG